MLAETRYSTVRLDVTETASVLIQKKGRGKALVVNWLHANA